ncbi:Iron transporter FTH1 [Wickerhamomyces ciferrii]|uniref:Iron transporter FTH1 n=1 Tax=Wickerhamomyces ciferrii (strain ATCC 14091 / BCRC 22168 / CBS 111 / JCM 3599 / NBRC 0793 / NRRL Y-1031 F-60-10) TaxID=1206466 RepID=K0KQ35_WICCF|nr:Iron transporter FTH1 [Wickerhamomyces ciferrii]CCH45156.1 Iron transporter FTH1 [Wickerhamomyces ciferrii]
MVDFEDIFSFEIFFIILRESLEIIIIVSILLAFLKQSLILHHSRDSVASSSDELNNEEVDLLLDQQDGAGAGATTRYPDDNVEGLTETGEKLYKQFRLQIWSGSLLGLFVSLIIGGIFITVFYLIGTDLWSLSEHYYEGSLSLLASVVISIMGLFFLRLSKLKEKFRVKLANILINKTPEQIASDKRSKFKIYAEKYALFILPFITCLRESLEAFVFIGGVGVGQPLSTLPLSSILGIAVSAIVGVSLYKRTESFSLKVFLISTTCLLYLIAAGLFSKGIWQFELQRYINLCHGQDMSEVGSGPGSYDVTNSVWHVNCCNGEMDGLWMLFTAIFGWTNSATYGSVISYIVYWSIIIFTLKNLQFEETNGYFPWVPIKFQKKRLLKKYNFLKDRQKISNKNTYISSHLLSNNQ